MGINVVRRSGISRALSGVGFAMFAIVAVVVAAYAALALAAVGFVVAVVVVVRHVASPRPAIVPVPHVTDDAVNARVAAILSR